MVSTADVTGMDLKLRRIGLRVKGREMASAMGVNPSRVSAIERQAYVSPEMVARYLAALGTLRDMRTGEAA